ncbi:glycosyltransferase family 117 protein [Roseimarinus sediminis]|uniref:glycosyltransferase family 117 protein n=1 Tax=Roseimarinus sediminis TaxID=1610899 RepID=UPI003D1917D0
MNYKKLNIVVGWITFAVAAIVYLMTIEPTTSFWDCGEFITTAFKLEVGHPPGAPFFMLIGRFFTLLAGPDLAAVSMNVMSALASAFTILFLFWTITHLTRRLISNDEQPSAGELIAIMGSGVVGALAYTFSDTFWFSAVEAEVYATSSLFTAMVFWAILKWENIADQPYSNRWLILICYLAGLSVGVHLLNLLAIPAIAFIYYYKKYKVTNKGIFVALVVSGLILGLILYGIIPGIVKIASIFERLLVNGMGAPLHSGSFLFIALLLAAIVYGIYITHKKQMVLTNTVIVGITVIVIGFSTYMIIPIRSNANLPMDQNSPNNVFAMLSYLNREQYGDRPLVHGQHYNSPLDSDNPYVHDKNEYRVKDGKYVLTNERQKPNYADEFSTFFPRMWSKSDPRHIEAYKQWGNIKGMRMTYRGQGGETETIMKPTFAENLRFFFRYQVNFMYFRYFMWNFAGRQNDIQGHGNVVDGNWISGIKLIDEARLGNQDNLPAKYADNPGRNRYYFLPLLLGIIGIWFQYKAGRQGKRDLWVVSLLFILTGIAIVVYLNQYPYQPRERDYAYAGSFYAFTIWIGLGVAGLYKMLKKLAPETVAALTVSAVSLLAVPVLMAAENWDDHDRSGRTSARDFGYNYLASVDEQGIVFTNGDNDTYPLWYNQEVEGVGTSKRVCNLSYFQTDWYVNQMQRKAYESEPLPISFEYDQYVMGTRDIVYIMEDPRLKGKSIELGKALDFIKDDDPRTKIARAENASYLPVRSLYMVVDKEAVIANGVVSPEDYDQIVDTMHIELSGSYIAKDQLMLLDMLYHNNWKRAMYFAISVGSDKYLSLDKYFRLEGFTYRIVPVLAQGDGFQRGSVDTERMYQNLMNEFKWGNVNAPGVYVDENNRRMLTNTRNNFQRLAEALILEGKTDSAIQVLDRCIEMIPAEKVPYDYFALQVAKTYVDAGAKEKAAILIEDMAGDFGSELEYYFSFDNALFASLESEVRSTLFFMNELMSMAGKVENESLQNSIREQFDLYYNQLLTQPAR